MVTFIDPAVVIEWLSVDLRIHSKKASCVHKRLDDVLTFINYSRFSSLHIWIYLYDRLENRHFDTELYIHTGLENLEESSFGIHLDLLVISHEICL